MYINCQGLLTSINLEGNYFGPEAAEERLAPALRDSPLTYLWYGIRCGLKPPNFPLGDGASACRWSEWKWVVRRCLLSSARVLSGERVKETPHAIHAPQHTSEYLLLHVCFTVRCDLRERQERWAERS
jgi:hypothetical protein